MLYGVTMRGAVFTVQDGAVTSLYDAVSIGISDRLCQLHWMCRGLGLGLHGQRHRLYP